MKRIGKIALYILIGTAAAVLSVRFLMPFLVAIAVAELAERPICFFQKKLNVPRTAVSIVCIFLILGAVGLLMFFLCRLVCSEFSEFIGALPDFALGLSQPLNALKNRLFAFAATLPDGIGTGFRAGIESLLQSGSLLGEKVYEWLFSFASDFIGKMPLILFSVFTAILSCFMLSADYPAVKQKLLESLPNKKGERVKKIALHIKNTLGHWLKAEAELALIIAAIVTVGLFVLAVEYPLLFGLLAGLVDALPVFGAGAVLIPWAVVLLLQSKIKTAVGMMILYVVTCIARQALEPKLIGSRMGISPLIMLGAIYVGFRIFGVIGMLILPLIVVLLKSFLGSNRLSAEP